MFEDELDILLGKTLSGDLSAPEAETLAEAFRKSPELAKQHELDTRLDMLLHSSHTAGLARFETSLRARQSARRNSSTFFSSMRSRIRSQGRSRILILSAACAAIVAITLSLVSFENAPDALPMCESVTGPVLMRSAGKEIPVVVGQATPAGATIELVQGSQATFRYPDGTVVTAQANSELEFATYSSGTKSVNLKKGSLEAQVSRQESGNPFVVRSGAETVEVLGTRFIVASGEGFTVVEVREGKILLKRNETNEQVLVSAGEFAVAKQSAQLSVNPVSASTPEFFRELAASTPAATRDPAGVRTQPVTLRNGNMSAGEDVPIAWDGVWRSKGEIKIVRDSEVYRSAPASLRIESIGGSATGQAFQRLSISGKRRLRMEGFIKSRGNASISAGVQPYHADGRAETFLQVKFVWKEQDWLAFSGVVELPEYTSAIGVSILLDGDGKAWLDDVKLSLVNAP